MHLNGINLREWVEEHRHLLKPPVGNQEIFPGGDAIVMAIGGPNTRKDYHVNQGPEFYYQFEGDMTLKIIDQAGNFRDVPIREGDVYLLPANVPHSPQRPADTVGLVLEHKRQPGELDAFQWYCEECGHKLYEEQLEVTDIVKQLPAVFDRFYNNIENRTCDHCGAVMALPPSRQPASEEQ
jgi:3-hydroxyanthranilate 3,4-dioxygenase